jgi:hypothetical protein
MPALRALFVETDRGRTPVAFVTFVTFVPSWFNPCGAGSWQALDVDQPPVTSDSLIDA